MREGARARRALFDPGRDFGERRDLGAGPAADALEATLARIVADAARTQSAPATSGEPADPERLKALGYAE